MELEKTFLEGNVKEGLINVLCGGKSSGKTRLFLSYLKAFYNVYDEIHLLLPQFYDETDNKYKFIEKLDNCIVYLKYDESIFENVKKASETKRILFAFDDATNDLFTHKSSGLLNKIFTTSRHGEGITVFIMTHAIVNILLPHNRANVDNLFIGLFRNEKVIKSHLWQENLSLKISYKEFNKLYVDNVLNKYEEHPFLYLNKSCNIDWNVNKWSLLKYYDYQLKQNGKCKIVKGVNNDKKIREKFELKKHENIIRDEVNPTNKIGKFGPFRSNRRL